MRTLLLLTALPAAKLLVGEHPQSPEEHIFNVSCAVHTANSFLKIDNALASIFLAVDFLRLKYIAVSSRE